MKFFINLIKVIKLLTLSDNIVYSNRFRQKGKNEKNVKFKIISYYATMCNRC